jgi:hypothetical protein
VRAALIPPKGLYHTALKSDYHLALAQIDTEDYLKVYAYDIEEGDFLILDNGAAEGQAVSNEELYFAARRIGAVEEVVAPDVMLDYPGTYAAVTNFLNETKTWYRRHMLVVQGRTWSDVYSCIDAYHNNFSEAKFTYGIPRHMLTTLDTKYARLQILDYIQKRYGEPAVHLLGTNPMWPMETFRIAREFSWVRGVDSSLPYNFAIQGVDLEKSDHYNPISRPEGYFEKDWSKEVNHDLVAHNIRTFLSWARGA